MTSAQYVCPNCTKRLGFKIVCQGSTCGRCTGACQVEKLETAEEGAPNHEEALAAVRLQRARLRRMEPVYRVR